jgi:hypothetical protein
MKPTVSVARSSNSKSLQASLKKIDNLAVYVGIPTTNAAARKKQLITLAEKASSTRKTKLVAAAAASELNNAEILYIFSKGSEISHQPARPVLEPAIEADGNRQAIAHEIAQATKATLENKPEEAKKFLKRAGMAGSNAAKKWFTDDRNSWAPNAPRTIAEKGSDRPGVDTGVMKDAITYVVKEESDE